MSENLLRLLLGAGRARKHGLFAVERRQRTHLADVAAFARTNPPYYRKLYRALPERIKGPALLPVTNKKRQMTRFDDWATDRQVALAKASAFGEPSPDRGPVPGQANGMKTPRSVDFEDGSSEAAVPAPVYAGSERTALAGPGTMW